MTTRKTLKIGSIVQCRYFNTPENKFYGELFESEVIGKNANKWTVKRSDGYVVSLHRKEIKRILV
jgi:hypothetical protein